MAVKMLWYMHKFSTGIQFILKKCMHSQLKHYWKQSTYIWFWKYFRFFKYLLFKKKKSYKNAIYPFLRVRSHFLSGISGTKRLRISSKRMSQKICEITCIIVIYRIFYEYIIYKSILKNATSDNIQNYTCNQ